MERYKSRGRRDVVGGKKSSFSTFFYMIEMKHAKTEFNNNENSQIDELMSAFAVSRITRKTIKEVDSEGGTSSKSLNLNSTANSDSIDKLNSGMFIGEEDESLRTMEMSLINSILWVTSVKPATDVVLTTNYTIADLSKDHDIKDILSLFNDMEYSYKNKVRNPTWIKLEDGTILRRNSIVLKKIQQ